MLALASTAHSRVDVSLGVSLAVTEVSEGDTHGVVEELLELLVGVVDAQLLEAVELEDFESGNVEDSDEGGSLALGPVQRPVDPGHDPLEQPLVHGLGDGLDGELDLFLVSEREKWVKPELH